MSDVIIRVENGVGRLTLNRPSALHSLTTDMCADMARALEAWAGDDGVRCVLLDHAEDTRGFCAGGDIRKVAESGRADGRDAAQFFATEYRMNVLIKRFPKPFVAIMDGVTMGGGVGISVHGSHRIATERTLFAMPETGIGLFPDVGGGWFLPRLEGELGTWLALTGARLRGEDVVHAGIGTHFVPSERIGALKEALMTASPDDDLDWLITKHSTLTTWRVYRSFVVPRSVHPVEKTLEEVADAIRRATAAYAEAHPGVIRQAEEPEDSDEDFAPSYAEHLGLINCCFAKDNVADICIALKMADDDWATAQAEILATRSPVSLCVSLEQLRRGRAMTSFEDVMRMEYRIASRITRSHDFSEGVRAVIEDKDHAPKWSPATVSGITPAMVETMFAPLDHELEV